MTIAPYRILIGVVVLLLLAWFFLPVLMPIQEHRLQVLASMAGYAAVFPKPVIAILSLCLLATQLVGLVGLALLLPWGKWILLTGVSGMVLASPFVGVAVETPAGVFVGFLATLLEGVLLAMAFRMQLPEASA